MQKRALKKVIKNFDLKKRKIKLIIKSIIKKLNIILTKK